MTKAVHLTKKPGQDTWNILENHPFESAWPWSDQKLGDKTVILEHKGRSGGGRHVVEVKRAANGGWGELKPGESDTLAILPADGGKTNFEYTDDKGVIHRIIHHAGKPIHSKESK